MPIAQLPIYTLKQDQLKRYTTHNIVSVNLENENLTRFVSGCSIDASELNSICRPKYTWISKYGNTAPTIAIASEAIDKSRVPKNARALDKILDALVVEIFPKNTGYEVELKLKTKES